MKFKKCLALILCLMLIFFTFGCSNKAAQSNAKIKIVTSFYPMYIFTKNLTKGIDDIQVTNMTKQVKGCLHDYQLKSDDMVALNDADVFVINGAGMENFLSKVTKQLPDLEIVSASNGIDLIKNDGENNSHVWMSVPNAIKQVNNISAALCKKYPEYADSIKANKKAYIASLFKLDTEIREEMKPYANSQIMTFHEAYNYFAKEYGLKVSATIEDGENQEPSVKKIANLIKLIKDDNVKALFVEPEYKGSSAQTLANETGIKIYTLNPVTSGDGSLTSYQDMMRKDVKTIKEALS